MTEADAYDDGRAARQKYGPMMHPPSPHDGRTKLGRAWKLGWTDGFLPAESPAIHPRDREHEELVEAREGLAEAEKLSATIETMGL